jgi:hypothetical protein
LGLASTSTYSWRKLRPFPFDVHFISATMSVSGVVVRQRQGFASPSCPLLPVFGLATKLSMVESHMLFRRRSATKPEFTAHIGLYLSSTFTQSPFTSAHS